MSNESIEDLGAKFLLPVAVIGVIVFALAKGVEVVWEWMKLHSVFLISIVGGAIGLAIVMMALVMTLNAVEHRSPRLWNGLKIGCATFVVLVVVLIILLTIFANQ